MANLKNRILQTLQKGKNLEPILDDLLRSQENLLKNHSNPVFNNKDKNKILNQYTKLQNIGKSLYRYNTLNENGNEAAEIEEAIADSERDQVANRLGRERGRDYPDCKCYDLMQDLLPNYKK